LWLHHVTSDKLMEQQIIRFSSVFAVLLPCRTRSSVIDNDLRLGLSGRAGAIARVDRLRDTGAESVAMKSVMAVRLGLTLVLAGSAAACGSSSSGFAPSLNASATGPTPIPTTLMASVSGTVWLHAPDGVRPHAGARVGAWVETGSSGTWTWGSVDGSARYHLSVPDGARVRIQVGANGAFYQPCAITLHTVGNISRDVRIVSDTTQLGARLPAPFLAQTPMLSGFVYELAEDGRRIPVRDARVELDGLFGLGLVTATTLTDVNGRYVFCGLDGDASTYLYASKTTYSLFEATVTLGGNTTRDIEMRKR
jgi:hypothetical protein